MSEVRSLPSTPAPYEPANPPRANLPPDQTMRFFAAFSLIPVLAATLAAAEFVCKDATTLRTATAGQNGEVQVEYLHCANADEIRAQTQVLRFERSGLEKRQANVCGAPCA